MCASIILCCAGENCSIFRRWSKMQRGVCWLELLPWERLPTPHQQIKYWVSIYSSLNRHVADHCVTVCVHCCVFRLWEGGSAMPCLCLSPSLSAQAIWVHATLRIHGGVCVSVCVLLQWLNPYSLCWEIPLNSWMCTMFFFSLCTGMCWSCMWFDWLSGNGCEAQCIGASGAAAAGAGVSRSDLWVTFDLWYSNFRGCFGRNCWRRSCQELQ